MEYFFTFAFSFFFSFIGSIPPGTLNLTILQLGLENKIAIAWRFALAAALVEYPYAWIAVKFERLITRSPVIIDNMHLVAAIVMIALGALNFWSATSTPTKLSVVISKSGFRRGIVLSVLNPLAIPYWIGITAYMRSQNWVVLQDPLHLHSYLAGVFAGALLLLITLAYLARRVVTGFLHNPWIKKVPGFALLLLGLYAFIQYLF
jgi:threonine/homoserine/homoserine lactone efflux protein